MLTARNLPDEVHRALRVRAAQHGRSTEAEIRDILATAVRPQTRIRLGGPSGKLIDAADAGDIELFTSPALLAELTDVLHRSRFARLIVDAAPLPAATPKKRGPAPKIQQQLEQIGRLPKAKQRAVMQVLDSILAQAR